MQAFHDFNLTHIFGCSASVGVVGGLLGWLAGRFALRVSGSFRQEQQLSDFATSRDVRWVMPGMGLLFALYWFVVFGLQAHATHEVRPDLFWVYGRAISHLSLITLIVTATATDFLDYIIPDSITLTGMLLGVGVATASGDVQLMHLWVDWNHPQVAIYGQWIPEWIKHHHHWHGLAWSMAGLVGGGGLTWASRVVSSVLLKQESLGFGDVTLMAMIGSFIGWQPVLFVFLMAPVCGLLIGMLLRTLTNKSYVPYGPYLSLATVLVLLSWKWLWQFEIAGVLSIRKLFGDPIGLAILSGIGIVAFVLLLIAVRLYRLIPGKEDATNTEPEPNTERSQDSDDSASAVG